MKNQVAIVILTKNNPQLVKNCVSSIIKHNTATDNMYYICDTGSTQENLKLLKRYIVQLLPDHNGKMYHFDTYHFAGNNNEIILNQVSEPYVLLCNDDIIMENDCLDQMYNVISTSQNVASVGCRLIFPDQKIQHAGQLAYIDETGLLQCTHRGYGLDCNYDNSIVLGCTAACLLVDRGKYIQSGGFDERYTECWEDIQLSMRWILSGYNNWYLDTAIATHLESQTRTKTEQAKYRLRYDYTYKLKPWFDSLPTQTQQLLLNI